MTMKDAHKAERLEPSGTSRRVEEFEHYEYKIEDERSFFFGGGELSLKQVWSRLFVYHYSKLSTEKFQIIVYC